MATLAAVTNIPALALLGEDGKLEHGTEPFRRWFADKEELCKQSPELQRVLDGQANAAILKLDGVAVDIAAVSDRAWRSPRPADAAHRRAAVARRCRRCAARRCARREPGDRLAEGSRRPLRPRQLPLHDVPRHHRGEAARPYRCGAPTRGDGRRPSLAGSRGRRRGAPPAGVLRRPLPGARRAGGPPVPGRRREGRADARVRRGRTLLRRAGRSQRGRSAAADRALEPARRRQRPGRDARRLGRAPGRRGSARRRRRRLPSRRPARPIASSRPRSPRPERSGRPRSPSATPR